MGARFAAIALSLAVGIGPCLARADEVARSDVPESAKPSAKLSASLGISPLRLGGIAVGGLGATGLLTGLGLALKSRAVAGLHDDLCAPGAPCASQRAFDLDHQARLYKQWSIVSAAVGALVTGAGIWMIVSGDRRTAELAGTTSLRLAPSLDGRSFEVSMSGAW